MKPESYKRSRIEILNYVLNFGTYKSWDNDRSVRLKEDDCYFVPTGSPNKGDLVLLSSAPFGEWYLSWYLDTDPKENGFDIHLLQSLETGKLCNWTNVSFNHLNRKFLDKRPDWRWVDKQWEFKDRWWRACYRKRDAHMTLPKMPVFHDDGSVTLSTRTRYNLDDKEPTRKFLDWRKVLVRDMLDFYDEVVSEKNSRHGPRRRLV